MKKMEHKVIPNVTATLIEALEEIKEVIKLNPQKEIVSSYTLTLLKIYDIIEEAEKQVNLQHK